VVYALAQRHAQGGDAANAIETLKEAIARNPMWKALAARNANFDKDQGRPGVQETGATK